MSQLPWLVVVGILYPLCKEIAIVPEVVIGDPATDKPVGTLTATLVTVPEPETVPHEVTDPSVVKNLPALPVCDGITAAAAVALLAAEVALEAALEALEEALEALEAALEALEAALEALVEALEALVEALEALEEALEALEDACEA